MRTSLQFGDARACSVRAASYHEVQACEYLQITSNYKCLLQRHVGGFNSGEGAGSFLDISIPNEPSGCVYLSLYGDIQPKIPCYHLIDQHRTCLLGLFQELQLSFDSFLIFSGTSCAPRAKSCNVPFVASIPVVPVQILV